VFRPLTVFVDYAANGERYFVIINRPSIGHGRIFAGFTLPVF
jgi:hypothetical protein